MDFSQDYQGRVKVTIPLGYCWPPHQSSSFYPCENHLPRRPISRPVHAQNHLSAQSSEGNCVRPKYSVYFEILESSTRSLKPKLTFSTAYHPQTDGQTERMNQILEDVLRTYVLAYGSKSEDCFPYAEFSYNKQLSVKFANGPKLKPFREENAAHP